jgi:chorismate mutase-like protein
MDELDRLRHRIDTLDEEIAARLAQRFETVRMVGQFKRAENIEMMQADRVRHVHEHYQRCASEQGIPPEFTKRFVELLLATTCAMEDEIIAGSASST